MRKYASLALSLALCAGTARAQNCGDLQVTGNGAPGTDVVLDLVGSTPNAFAFCAIGDTQGTTTIHLGSFATLTMDLATPFIPIPMGRTDANGDASLTISVPSGFAQSLDLYGQAVAVDFGIVPGTGISLSFCVSDVEMFHLGT